LNEDFVSFGDHTTGSGSMMLLDGYDMSKVVWSQSVPVTPGRSYTLSAWFAVAPPAQYNNPAILQFQVNGTVVGRVDIGTNAGDWQHFTVSWTADSGNTARIEIYDANPNPMNAGDDFALDDIFLTAGSVIPSPVFTAPASLHSSPTAVEGVVYVGCDDGKLYARTTADGSPAPGFPVDLASGRLLARPAVYTQGAQTAVYTTTEDGHVVKVLPNGTVAWSVQPLAGGSSASTPAITPDGAVYAGLSDASGSYVLKLDASNGSTLKRSASLGTGSVGSPAVQGGSVYVTVQNGTDGGILLLDSSELTVKASFAPNESASTPHVKDGILYVGTDAGNVYKVNSATMALDTAFGTAGHAAIGEAVTTEAFPDSAGHLYVGTGAGKVFQVAAGTGASSLFHDSGGGQAVGGLVLDYDSGLLAYGTAGGDFWQVPTGNVTAATRFPLAGSFTTPTLDRSTNAFYAGTDAGNLYGVPRL
jgi:outer membrane protein assembly factor BamB